MMQLAIGQCLGWRDSITQIGKSQVVRLSSGLMEKCLTQGWVFYFQQLRIHLLPLAGDVLMATGQPNLQLTMSRCRGMPLAILFRSINR